MGAAAANPLNPGATFPAATRLPTRRPSTRRHRYQPANTQKADAASDAPLLFNGEPVTLEGDMKQLVQTLVDGGLTPAQLKKNEWRYFDWHTEGGRGTKSDFDKRYGAIFVSQISSMLNQMPFMHLMRALSAAGYK